MIPLAERRCAPCYALAKVQLSRVLRRNEKVLKR
jgi:hypothetical protein